MENRVSEDYLRDRFSEWGGQPGVVGPGQSFISE